MYIFSYRYPLVACCRKQNNLVLPFVNLTNVILLKQRRRTGGDDESTLKRIDEEHHYPFMRSQYHLHHSQEAS